MWILVLWELNKLFLIRNNNWNPEYVQSLSSVVSDRWNWNTETVMKNVFLHFRLLNKQTTKI